MAKYDYAKGEDLSKAPDSTVAIHQSMITYLHGQLGWGKEDVEERIQKEIDRKIPKSLFDTYKTRADWHLDGARLIDVGAGQGGAVLEALHRGADAFGVEPAEEFAELARLRLREDGFDPERIHRVGGETLPFSEKSFDYAVSLQVLEHVEDPRPLLEETYRVLKPGGEAVVRCENYLAFREQHYRIPWLPLLPKALGSLYLKAIGRDPSFLNNYVFYSTYPQIWKLCADIGFENVTYQERLEKAQQLENIKMGTSKLLARVLSSFSSDTRKKIATWGLHAKKTFSVGIRLHLVKPRK